MADFYGGRFSTAANGRERSNGLRYPMWDGTDANNSSSVVTSQYELRRPVIFGSDDPAGGGYGRSWADTPTRGDSYAYTSDPYKAPAFISGVQTAVSSDLGGRLGLGGGGQVLHRPMANSYDYDNDGSYRYDEYSSISSRAEPWSSPEAGRGWQPRKSAAAEPAWEVGSKYVIGAARAAAGWGGEGKLSRATNVIDKAVEFLYDTPARPAGGIARTDPWGGWQQPASMYQTAKRSTGASSVMASREAANKHGGQFIW